MLKKKSLRLRFVPDNVESSFYHQDNFAVGIVRFFSVSLKKDSVIVSCYCAQLGSR